MSINRVSYNPYLYTGFKAANNSCVNAAVTAPSVFAANSNNVDTIQLTQTNNNQNNNKLSAAEARKELEKTKSEQGLIGKAWDGIKNVTGIGSGSNKAEQAIADYENGKITEEEMNKAVAGYKEGQEQCVDLVADITAGIAAFGAFAFATGIGLAAAPFTGGASLGLVAAGFAIAGTAGAAVKVAVKGLDCAVGGREYDTLGYDLATGGMNGMFAPITAGIGGAAGKAVAGRLGVTAIREGGEVIVQEAIEGTAKGALTRTLLTTNIKYVGGSMGARALALGTDMAVNGSITGAVDSGTRYIAGDRENKSLEGFAKEVGMGAVGGLLMAPVIGGGMRLAGNGIGKITGKLESKISTNYTQAKSAMMNTPVCENADIDVIRGFGEILRQTEEVVNNAHAKGSGILDAFDKNLTELSDEIAIILKSASTLNSDLDILSGKNREFINSILKELSESSDLSPNMAGFAKKGMSLADSADDKIVGLSTKLEELLTKIMATNEALSQRAASGIEVASQTIENAGHIANEAIEQAKKIPETDAFKQLGNLPERAKAIYDSFKSDTSSLSETIEAARAKLASGNIKEGFEDLARYYEQLNILNSKLEQQLSSIQSSASRSGIEESAEVLRDRISKLIASEKFQNMTREEQIQALMENSNILFSKFAQTFSSNESLPPEVQGIFKQFTSNCTVSRNMAQAQILADELYGAGKYTILKSFGAGTIGETYLAKTADGTEVVIKMLKEGVTPEKFAQDRAMFTRYINEFVEDGAEKEYKLNLINNMFDAWDKELNFALEAQGAKSMAEGAKRFSVAQTLEVGAKNGQNISLVMEKANGIKLDSLLEMVKLYRENPTEYFSKYAAEIEANPALKTPENWMGDLSKAYQKAQNEQTFFVGQSGTRTIHADPHPGNVFVDFDLTTGKPKIVYIDTGNVVTRTNSQTLQDIGLSMNMMLGNSRGIANAMLDGAILPEGSGKSEIAKRFAQLLDERLYKAGVDLRNTQYTQDAINSIMKELNVVPNSGNSNLMKATLQRVETYRAINRACDTTSNKVIDMQDLIAGIIKSMKVNPKETIKTIQPIMKWAYQNNDQAMITLFQMILKKPITQMSAIAA